MKLTKKLIALAAIACTMTVSAQSAQYKLEVGDFSDLKVTDGINVEYYASTDSAGIAYFECDKSIADMLMFTNSKNTLNIQLASDGQVIKNLPTIKVYSMTLQKVENSGDSTLRVCRTIPVRDFSATIIGNGSLVVMNLQAHKADGNIKTGSGHLVLNGKTRQANLKNVGTGTIEASGLISEDTKCNILGTGNIDCNASASLSIKGAGSGKVFYGGTPSKISNHSIGIKAISIDNKQELN